MPFCSYCGKELSADARFCPSCGSPAEPAAVIPAQEVMPAAPVNTVPVNVPETADYGIVLYSIGTCAKSYADDVLEDILGYSDRESKQLLKMLPAQIAQYLTAEQARYIAQALTEYGMQVAIYMGQTPVDLGQYATQSVFNSDGSFVAAALAALAGITVTNRIRKFRRWTLSNILSALFAPRYRVTAPPRHVTRATFRREPVAPYREPVSRAPVTAPRRASVPQRAEPKRRLGTTAPRSSAPSRGVGGRGPSGGPGHGGGSRGRR